MSELTAGLSIFKSMLIASNFDHGFNEDAVEQARLRLAGRYHTKKLDLKRFWQEETELLLERDKLCVMCRSPRIEYSEDIYFCTEEAEDIEEEGKINLPEFIPEIISEIGIATRHTRDKAGFRYAKGKFKLCHNCLLSHKNNKQGTLRITLREYYDHPLYSYYEALGFNRVKQKLD
jgi:hypothetical protein